MKDYPKPKYLLVFSLILISQLFACKNDNGEKPKLKKTTDDELIISVLSDSLKLHKAYSRIFYLTEKGCHNCNKSFLNFIQSNFSTASLYVISAKGTIIDISFFLDHPDKNIVFDDYNYFENIQAIKGSSVIYLKNNKIDTIVEINSDGLEEQFDYILNRN